MQIDLNVVFAMRMTQINYNVVFAMLRSIKINSIVVFAMKPMVGSYTLKCRLCNDGNNLSLQERQ